MKAIRSRAADSYSYPCLWILCTPLSLLDMVGLGGIGERGPLLTRAKLYSRALVETWGSPTGRGIADESLCIASPFLMSATLTGAAWQRVTQIHGEWIEATAVANGSLLARSQANKICAVMTSAIGVESDWKRSSSPRTMASLIWTKHLAND
jgi:hypothetical protein